MLFSVTANLDISDTFEKRACASWLDAHVLIVIITEDTSRVSNIYTKQVLQNTEDYFRNQFSYLRDFLFFTILGLIGTETTLISIG